MSTTYMNLDLPSPTVTDGPEWATDLNTALTTIDAHDHSSDKGTQIPTSGISINADLSFENFAQNDVETVRFEDQAAALATSDDIRNLYVITGNLWYNNGSGIPVQLTSGTSISTPSSPLVPAGIMLDYAGISAPSGYLLCDGTAVSRATYTDLFSAIGTVWGVGDGATTFNVPDFRGRVSVGAGTGSGLTSRTLADTDGEEDHELLTAEMPAHTHVQNAHTHTVTDPGHTHAAGTFADLSSNVAFRAGSNGTTGTATTDSATTGITNQNTTAVNQNTGGGNVHNNMQPYAVATKIIKT